MSFAQLWESFGGWWLQWLQVLERDGFLRWFFRASQPPNN
ncbi:hypothetical protein J122_4132 [Marinobacter excellens LAMA 842]|uniref:Uncharacterized protein n=1 Tax=Marinobacter excellens LAMA 842 TaxID=1306954 RepID=A0A137S1G9_9GAMM|nr:hypothetical protein J122_4132 [Marinobacter excellens LAMA 842]